MLEIPLRRLVDDLPLPSYAREGDAGADLVAAEDVTLAPGGGRALVPTGAAIAIPEGYAGFVQPRSGLALRHGVTCLNTPGLIDAGYRGELKVLLVNTDPTVPFEATRVAHLGDCYSPGDTDLAWTRLTHWREQLAAVLDQPPYEPITAVEVRGAETSPSTALLAAWLRLTLGVPVDWHYLSPDEWSDGIKSVRLTRASGDIVLERSSTAIACLTQPGQPQHDLVLPRRTLRECLAEELRRLDADLLYGRVITEGWALLDPPQSQETHG